jgi:hypothetical protein
MTDQFDRRRKAGLLFLGALWLSTLVALLHFYLRFN